MNEVERAAQVALAEAGNADALQHLLVEYHTVLLRLVDGSIDPTLRHRVEPDDVLQEAYVAAFRALSPPGAGEKRAPRSAVPVHDRTEDADLDEDHGASGNPPDPPRFSTPAGFYKWLERIVINELRDTQRAARRKKRDPARRVDNLAPGPGATASYPDLLALLTASGTSPSRVIARHEAAATVLTCLARLSAEQRTVVRLRFLQDVPVAQIAQQLGKTETAVYALCQRGLKALRELLAPFTQSQPGQ